MNQHHWQLSPSPKYRKTPTSNVIGWSGIQCPWQQEGVTSIFKYLHVLWSAHWWDGVITKACFSECLMLQIHCHCSAAKKLFFTSHHLETEWCIFFFWRDYLADSTAAQKSPSSLDKSVSRSFLHNSSFCWQPLSLAEKNFPRHEWIFFVKSACMRKRKAFISVNFSAWHLSKYRFGPQEKVLSSSTPGLMFCSGLKELPCPSGTMGALKSIPMKLVELRLCRAFSSFTLIQQATKGLIPFPQANTEAVTAIGTQKKSSTERTVGSFYLHNESRETPRGFRAHKMVANAGFCNWLVPFQFSSRSSFTAETDDCCRNSQDLLIYCHDNIRTD